MILEYAKEENVKELVRMSKEAFDSDVAVGAEEAGGPPEYDSLSWHQQMMHGGHLFQAIEDGKLIGGALLFRDDRNTGIINIGRIFVDPVQFQKGYGVKIMQEIEKLDPRITMLILDTPIWNRRTNQFYQKLGYREKRRDKELVYYEKEV